MMQIEVVRAQDLFYSRVRFELHHSQAVMANIVPSGRLLRSLRSSIRHDALLQGQCRSLYAQRCASDRFSATPSRSFSTTPACTAAKKEDPLLKQMSAAQPKQKAMSLVKEQAMSRMEIPDDVGLLPGTQEYTRHQAAITSDIAQQPLYRLHGPIGPRI